MSCREIRELITGFVDDQISAQERVELERHLGTCPACATEAALERRMKVRTREAAMRVDVPADLRAQLTEKYGAQPGSLWLRIQAWSQRLTSLRPVPALALLLLLLVPVALLVTDAGKALPIETLEVHRAVVSGEVGYSGAESPDLLAQELSRSVGGVFAPPVYDMSEFGLYTTGGFRRKVRDRNVLVTVYKGNADTLTCHTFLGDERDIPEEAQLVYDPADGRKYFTFSDGSINGVLQRYGDEVCVLVSRLPMDELIRVARAVRPTHHG